MDVINWYWQVKAIGNLIGYAIVTLTILFFIIIVLSLEWNNWMASRKEKRIMKQIEEQGKKNLRK